MEEMIYLNKLGSEENLEYNLQKYLKAFVKSVNLSAMSFSYVITDGYAYTNRNFFVDNDAGMSVYLKLQREMNCLKLILYH